MRIHVRKMKFERKHNIPIYVGEFCAIRYLKGSDRWVKDVIDIFEDFGWGWTYQAYRAGTVCDAELGTDKNNKRYRMKNNVRIQLLKEKFSKNENYYNRIR